MTREEFFYQCMDVIEHWLNGNRKLSDLREVTDKLYNEVTKPHWISVEEELPPIGGIVLVAIPLGGELSVLPLSIKNESDFECLSGMTHWMPLPQPPKKGGNQ